MKKIISILIILSVFMGCFVGNALADEFSVRNGIHFGMTIDEVKQIEIQNGLPDPVQGDDYLVYNDVNIAGIDDGRISYEFTDNKLSIIDYWFGLYVGSISNTGKNVPTDKEKNSIYNRVKNIFDTLDGALSEKYELIGSKIDKENIEYVSFKTKDNYWPFERLGGIYCTEGNTFNLYGFKQYLAKDIDNYVQITNKCYHYESYLWDTDAYFGKQPTVEIITEIQYTPVSIEQMTEKLEESEALKNKKNNDL